ncbi:SPOR domain-containing protein [Polynucleobacter sp. MWH-Spelu-300-X4]|uniref:SPOR domain-containing protein n=1 Tax=Polynucleobacter sp. MWH-Spelu-300-X4 TaxID=2689109 RepID=UPI001BFE5B28|nr:SPOR domain-containing protein [Polynucleobacter sp. MWH-Spelu-300-X4]QWD79066.1 SPOR domain-containing protein [Polynucleobacter sp. MWH-Spelu-300-X4]
MRLPFFNRSQAKDSYPTEDTLTEDPERQRARHRLIGAVFLVFVAVVGLPLIFDSKPKQYNNDVVIQIIQPGSKNEKASDEKSEKKAEEPKKDSKDVVETKKEESKSEKAADKSVDKAPAVAKTLDKGEEVLTILEDRKSDSKASTGKFIIQIGAFSSEARVKNWQTKLKEQKVSTYLDTKNNKEGVKLYLLRSGPYADKAAADAVEKKIRYVGLSPKIVEQKSE